MKRINSSLLVLSLLSLSLVFSAACFAHSVDKSHDSSSAELKQALLQQEAKQRVQKFATTLKGALVSAIQAKGLAHAVNVCKEQAPEIAKGLSTDGWEVSRTSLQARNSKNKPDAWETRQLHDFDKALKTGAAANELVATKINDASYRFMKAIPTQQVCLACHGTHVEPKLLDLIQSNYPEDKATGYNLQDIRGAFSLSKNIAQESPISTTKE